MRTLKILIKYREEYKDFYSQQNFHFMGKKEFYKTLFKAFKLIIKVSL